MITSIAGIGSVRADQVIPEWLESESPVAVPLLEGEELPFVIGIDDLDETLLPAVEESIASFLSLGTPHRLQVAEGFLRNYRDAVAKGASDDLVIEDAAGTWAHVRALRVNVLQGAVGDDAVYVQVAFDCDWEEEHGLQAVFRDGKELVRVSQEDGHMTEEVASAE